MQGAVVFLGAASGLVCGVTSLEHGVGAGEFLGVAVHGFPQMLNVVGHGQGQRVPGLAREVGGGGVWKEGGFQGAPVRSCPGDHVTAPCLGRCCEHEHEHGAGRSDGCRVGTVAAVPAGGQWTLW
ncbi:hypothetical protein, partial [Streptomyces sp. NPDC001410]|uniref:hypothetical protein n=1 Tax=Streptomyces sp. NPDC001410 TaxID=3364574 RepID=UPI0036738AA5